MNLRHPTVLAGVALAALLAGCGERPPVESVQTGFRGTGMAVVVNPRLALDNYQRSQLPEVIPPVPEGGPPASAVYQNVQVLGDLSVAEFTRVMLAITQWVSPVEGCNYCHVGDMASDDVYTKVVSRRMIEMTRAVNANWGAHVGQTGVTCYTCHRGQHVPPEHWFVDPGPAPERGITASRAQQNVPVNANGLSSLPYDPFTPFLLGDAEIRVQGATALPTGNRQSIKQTEWTYSLMTHMSRSLGVSCNYCHNSRSWADWDQSRVQRTTAWNGIRLARELNNEWLLPLTDTFPAHRLGPLGDVAKINCGTCHGGAFKPLFGAPMLRDYPALAGPAPAAAPAGMPAETTPSADDPTAVQPQPTPIAAAPAAVPTPTPAAAARAAPATPVAARSVPAAGGAG